MIKGQIIGVVCSIEPAQQIRENFSKREIVVNQQRNTQDGRIFNNYYKVAFINERISMLDLYEVGNLVVLDVYVPSSSDPNKVYTSLRGLNIATYQNQWTPVQQQAYAPQQPQMQPQQPQMTQPQQPQQPISPAAQQTIQQLGTIFGQPFVQDGVTPMPKNDLPF